MINSTKGPTMVYILKDPCVLVVPGLVVPGLVVLVLVAVLMVMMMMTASIVPATIIKDVPGHTQMHISTQPKFISTHQEHHLNCHCREL